MIWDLVADIGGTNMRVAQVVDGAIVARHDFSMTKERDVTATLQNVAKRLGGKPCAIVCAGAGPVRGGEIRLTNGGWLVSETEIAGATGADFVRVINDFEAAAWSLARLTTADVRPLGRSGPLTPGHRTALGPGTGLGVGALLWDGTHHIVVPGEGGHVAVGPRTRAEVSVFEKLCALWPDAQIGDTLTLEAEALLSGTGLPVLYQACGGSQGVAGREIFERARGGEAAAQHCQHIFKTHLAALCGDTAVSVMAKGGVFLLGGVAQANPDLFDEVFWRADSEGGRFTELRQSCGLYLVTMRDFGLKGCINALLDHRRLQSTVRSV